MEIKSINEKANYTEALGGASTMKNTGNSVNLIQKKKFADGIDIQNSGTNNTLSEQQIKVAVEMANKSMMNTQTRCEFSYHEPTKSVSIKVINKQTDEVLLEVPPQKILDMIVEMWKVAGILVDEKR